MAVEPSPSLRTKLAARDRRRLATSTSGEALKVMPRLGGPPSEDKAARLRAAGLEVLFDVGPVVTGRVKDQDGLEAVAALPFVEQIELSGPLYTEGDPAQTTTR
jgi:hypothetical protein